MAWLGLHVLALRCDRIPSETHPPRIIMRSSIASGSRPKNVTCVCMPSRLMYGEPSFGRLWFQMGSIPEPRHSPNEPQAMPTRRLSHPHSGLKIRKRTTYRLGLRSGLGLGLGLSIRTVFSKKQLHRVKQPIHFHNDLKQHCTFNPLLNSMPSTQLFIMDFHTTSLYVGQTRLGLGLG